MIDLHPACDAMAGVIAGVRADQLAGPTPCTEYAVGDLVDHVDIVVRGALALAARDEAELARPPEAPDAAHLSPRWRPELVARLDALGDAWTDPSVWEGGGDVPGSDLPNETWGRIVLTELVVHGWDLAVATGQPFELPPATLQACLDHVAAFVPDAPVPGLWGPAVRIADDAPVLDRILAITGRSPAR